MSESKEDIAAATKEIVSGIGNDKSGPRLVNIIYFIGIIIFVIGVCYVVLPYYTEKNKEDTERNKYAIDTFNKELKETTDTIIKFDNSIANVNSSLSIQKSQIDETKSEQNEIKHTLSEHEKRITKLEVLEEIK